MRKDTELFIKNIQRTILIKGYVAVVFCLLMALAVVSLIPRTDKLHCRIGVQAVANNTFPDIKSNQLLLTGLDSISVNLKDISYLVIEIRVGKEDNADHMGLRFSKSDGTLKESRDGTQMYLAGEKAKLLNLLITNNIVNQNDLVADVPVRLTMNLKELFTLTYNKKGQK